jgi:putative ABC transport system permease protein
MAGVSIKMLWHNKPRLISTLMGVAVAFVLSCSQIGLMLGWCNTIAAIMLQANVDVWVMAKHTPAFDYGTPIPKGRLYQVRSAPGVAWAESMFMGWLFLQRPDGQVNIIELVGVDDGLAGAPRTMAENTSQVLLEPDAIIIDWMYRDQLGISQVGDIVEISDRRGVVRGFSKGVRTITAAPFVFTSLQTALKYDQRYRDDEITYVLARCATGTTPAQLRDSVASVVPSVQVLTTSQFIQKTTLYWMLETGLGLIVVTTAVLGMIVGAVIVSQALYAITNDHLGNYATLLALGFVRWQLVVIVMTQALILGVGGILIGSAVLGRISAISQSTPVPIETNLAVFAGIVVTFIGFCLAASFLSLRTVFRVDPVSIFHN